MEMQQVKYFSALSETLNFTRAAEVANISQPALTRAIKKLEDELGGPLFHRERGRTHLSELGQMMRPYFQSIQDSSQQAKTVAKKFKNLERARLKIGVMCTIGPATISSFLMRFCGTHPQIEVDLVDMKAARLSEMLVEGELEVALFASPNELDGHFHGLPLFEERFVLVVPPSHRLAKMDTVPCKELDGEPYVNRANCEYNDVVNDELAGKGIRMRKVFSSERDDWVLGMIKAGMGFGFFPEYSITDKDVEVRSIVEPEYVRTTQLVTVRGRSHSPAVGAFVRQARAEKWGRAVLH